MLLNSYDFFTELVRCCFLGGKQVINGRSYSLEPTLLRRYDLLRTEPEFGEKTGINRLFSELPEDFKRNAKSELYRKSKGWIDKGYKENKIKQFKINDDAFLSPRLSDSAIGIDTSTNDEITFICFAFFDNHKSAYHYLEKILKIPKSTHKHIEFKWNKLSPSYRSTIDNNLEIILKMSCEFVLILKTNSLVNPEEKMTDIFIKLINGCFSNYNHKYNQRLKLQKKLFGLSNEIPIHCDADFSPLAPNKIVKQFVKVLAGGNDYTPLHVQKESHESKAIQIADILCGSLKEHIINKNRKFLKPWEFDSKLKSKTKERFAKCYFWNNNLI